VGRRDRFFLFQILLSNIPTTAKTSSRTQQKNICLRNLLRTPLLANQPLKPKKQKNKALSPSLSVSIFDVSVCACVRHFISSHFFLALRFLLISFLFSLSPLRFRIALYIFTCRSSFFFSLSHGIHLPFPGGVRCFLFSFFLFNFFPLVLSGRAHTCPPLYAPQRAHTHTHAHHKGVCCVVWILFGWWLLLCVCGSVRPGGGEGRFQKKSNRFPFFAWGGAGIGASLSVAPRFHMARQQMHPPYRCVFFHFVSCSCFFFFVCFARFTAFVAHMGASSLCDVSFVGFQTSLLSVFSFFPSLSPIFFLFFRSGRRKESRKKLRKGGGGVEEGTTEREIVLRDAFAYCFGVELCSRCLSLALVSLFL